MAQRKYRVKTPISHGIDGQRREYKPGDVIVLEQEQGDAIPWACELLPPDGATPAPAAPKKK